MDKRLQKFITEVRAGLREGSVVTAPDVAGTIDRQDVWDELRRELEDVGISDAIIDENKEHIKAWFKTALQGGLMDEGEGHQLATGLVVGGSDSALTSSPPPPSDSGYGGSIRMNSVASMASANEEFEDKLRRENTSKSIEETFHNLAVSRSAPPVVAKKRSSAARMLYKFLKKDDAIIEAASDGDADKVSRLISLGVNVNTRDRWG